MFGGAELLTPNWFVRSQGRMDAATAPVPMRKLCIAKPVVRCSRVEVVAHERAEGLHRDVDRGIHEPEHSGRHPQHRGVGHHEQRERGEDRAARK